MDPLAEQSVDASEIGDQAIRGVAWTSMQKWAARIATLATFIVLARLLEPEHFGLVALASVFVGVVSALADAGFASYLLQAPAVDQRMTSTAFWSVLGSSLTLAGVLALSAPLWAQALRSPELTPVLQWLSLGIVLSGISSTQVALLKRRLAFKVLALRSLASIMVSCAVAVSLALTGAGVWSLVAQSLTLSATSAVILWSAARWRPSLTYSAGTGVEIARYGCKVSVSQIVMSLRSRGDDLVIAAVLGTTALGYWVVAIRLLHLLVDTVVSVISTVATPVFARLKTDRARLRRAYVRAVSSTVAVMAPIAVTVAILGPLLVPLIFGTAWAPSGDLARVVTLVGIVIGLVHFDRALMLALNRPGTELALATGLALFGLLVVAVAAPFGITAVAVAVVARAVLAWPVRLFFTARLLELDVAAFLARMGLLVLSNGISGASATLTYLALPQRVPTFAVVLIVSGVAITVSSATLRWLVPDVWREMREIVDRLLRRARGGSAPRFLRSTADSGRPVPASKGEGP